MSAEKTDVALGRLGFAAVEIVITSGPQKGSRFALKAGENIIGRSPECTVLLSETEVSRRHARITVDREIQFEDLGSAIGTILNGRLMMGSDFIFDNDEIKVGPYTLRVEIKRQESRRGIVAALVCLVLAILIFAVAMIFPDTIPASPVSAKAKAEKTKNANKNLWRNWDSLRLPDTDTLKEAGIALTPEAARVQYDFATRLYQDRFGDPGNAYQALLCYKRALAILRNLNDPETRPCIAGRSLERICKLREMIKRECDKRVFAFQRAYELKWWSECMRILSELRQVSPWPRDRYHHWAARQIKLLKRMLQG